MLKNYKSWLDIVIRRKMNLFFNFYLRNSFYDDLKIITTLHQNKDPFVPQMSRKAHAGERQGKIK